jgi:heme/copper-type cytochrome/quinol oxidase subunit 2
MLCVSAFVVVGVLVVMLFSTRQALGASGTPSAFQQSVTKELVWAAIPWLIMAAAATPAVMAIISGGVGR